MPSLRLLLASALLLGAAAAHADVRYEFVADTAQPSVRGDVTYTGSFSFVAPHFIRDQTIPVEALLTCTVTTADGSFASCTDQILDWRAAPHHKTQVVFGAATTSNPMAQEEYYFDEGAFTHPGTYRSRLNARQRGTLTVTIVPGN